METERGINTSAEAREGCERNVKNKTSTRGEQKVRKVNFYLILVCKFKQANQSKTPLKM